MQPEFEQWQDDKASELSLDGDVSLRVSVCPPILDFHFVLANFDVTN